MKNIILFFLGLTFGAGVYGQNFQLVNIQHQGDKTKFVDVLIMGDGYKSTEQGKLHTDAVAIANYLFTQSPFLEYKNYFNVVELKITSDSSGANHDSSAADCNGQNVPIYHPVTYLGCAFDQNNIHRLIVSQNNGNLATALANYAGYDQAVILSNSPHYGGAGGSEATATTHASAAEIAVHEIGHSFGGLGDEYFNGSPDENPNQTANNNAATIIWKNWLNDSLHPEIGIFQYSADTTDPFYINAGATGWYKPTQHNTCKMQFLGVPFCSVCKEAIIEKIHSLIKPIISVSPSTASHVSSNNQYVTFKLDTLIKPSPNTLKITWKVDNQVRQEFANLDSIQLDQCPLLVGQHTLTAVVEDTTDMIRINNHSSVHADSVKWTIDVSTPIPTPSPNDTLHGKIYNMTNTPVFKSNIFKCIETDGRNNIWAGSSGFGVSVLIGCKWDSVDNEFSNTGFVVRAMRRSPVDSSIWVGMSKTTPCLGYVGGVYVFSDTGNYTRYLPSLSLPNHNLNSLVVRSLDFNKVTKQSWAGCTPQICANYNNGGLAYFHNGNYDDLLDAMPPFGNNDTWVNALASDTSGLEYAGIGRSCGNTCQNPYILIRDSVGNFKDSISASNTSVLPFATSSHTYTIRALYVDKLNRLWVGGEMNGIGVRDNTGWHFLSNVDIPYPANAYVNFDAITEGTDSTIYIGTSNGLLRFKGNVVTNKCSWQRQVIAGMSSQFFNDIVFDSQNTMWIGTNEGIFTTQERVCLAVIDCGSSDTICQGATNGSICVGATGGTPPYGGDIGTHANLAPGTYTYSVTDASGSTATKSFKVVQSSSLFAYNSSQVNLSCNGATNGSVFVNASGGTAPYTGIGGFFGLNAGAHTFIVTDANGCTASTTVNITQPAGTPLIASSTKTDVACHGEINGSITVTSSGGNPPYTGGIGVHSNLGGGFYSYTITDNSGCTSSTSQTIIDPAQLTLSSLVNSLSCSGNGLDGSVVLTASGGTSPFSGDVGTITGLAGGSHTFTVTDSHGCTATHTDLIDYVQPVADAGPDQAVCYSNVFSFTLTGNTPASGETGHWEVVSGGGTFFPNPNSPSVFVHDYVPGFNSYRWVLTCGNRSASDEVTVYAAPLSSLDTLTILSSVNGIPVNNILSLNICAGDSITFIRKGGNPGAVLGAFHWYEGSCNNLLPGFATGDTIKVAPAFSTSYSIVAQSFCNVTPCLLFANVTVHSVTVETCNGIDDNCNGTIDEGCGSFKYFMDADNDGFGNIMLALFTTVTSAPAGFSADSTDCNDANSGIHPGATEICNGIDENCNGIVDDGSFLTFYQDADGDGFGNPLVSSLSCTPASGFVANSLDCDDSNSSVHPSASEVCNVVDDNCNGVTDEGVQVTFFRDFDGDGFGNPGIITLACTPPVGFVANNTDCNDANASLHPGATKSCNLTDDDCDGLTDEGTQTTFFRDFDGDGFGNPTNTMMACSPPAGFVANNTDCNDNNANIHPGGSEVCNGLDENCNGLIDDGSLLTFFRDADGDSFGNASVTTLACIVPAGFVTNSTDCNDANANIHPGKSEVCNLIDEDCDGLIDEGVQLTFFRDADHDGFGNPGITILACTLPAGYVTNSTDCNDGSPLAHPGASELCNGVDDDCDGAIDEGVKTLFFRDADGDGFGNPGVTNLSCTAPSGFVSSNTDCNDANATIHPGVPELCNGVDDNCNGTIDEGCPALFTYYKDFDGDGFGSKIDSITTIATVPPSGFLTDHSDCNDASGAIHPGAAETCNSIDDNCNGLTDEGLLLTFFRDADGDGFGTSSISVQACTQPSGFVANSTDCNDGNSGIHPGISETCNGLDDNCSGAIDEGVLLTFFRDADGDGFGNNAITTQACSPPAGFVSNSTDCNDGNSSIHPGATEICSNAVDENCNGTLNEGCCTSAPAVPGAITGSSSVCKGTISVPYSIAAVSTATSYTWTVSTGTIASGQGTIAITVNFPAAYTTMAIKVKATNACGTSALNTGITVTPPAIPAAPVFSVNPLKVCKGSTGVTYSVTQVGTNTYNWEIAGVLNTTNHTNSISVNFSPTYTSTLIRVQAVNVCGVVSGFTSITVTPPAVPAQPGLISGPVSVCPGTIGVNYSVGAVTGAAGYTWDVTIGGITTSTSGTNNFMMNFPAAYTSLTISVRAFNICGTAGTVRGPITIAPPVTPATPSTIAIAGVTPYCGNTSRTFSVTSVTGLTYAWSPNAMIASGQGTNSVVINLPNVTATTSLTVTVSATNACGVSNVTPRTRTISVTKCTTRMAQDNQAAGEEFVIVPNPVTNEATVIFNATEEESYLLEIIDITGKVLERIQDKTVVGQNQITLHLNEYSVGIYFLTLLPEMDKPRTIRFVKQ